MVSPSDHRPHVLLLPFPSQGHLNPCLSFAHSLAASRISVTLVRASHDLTPSNSSSPHGLRSPASSKPFPELPSPLREEFIPGGFDRSGTFSITSFLSSLDEMRTGLTDLLHKLILEDNPPTCLAYDSVFVYGDTVASMFGLSRVALWVSGASTFCLGCHLPDIIAHGFIPATGEGSMEKMVDFVPGLAPFCISDMPMNLIAREGLECPRFVYFSSIFQRARTADRVLINTMYELEISAVDALRKDDGVDIATVGPLYMMSAAEVPMSHHSKLPEDESCLTWLDEQEVSSVLYIAFGSMAVLDEETVVEMAHGLEASGERFLWVIRQETYMGKASLEELMPEGFLERTRGQGTVISWAPQVAVLSHPSIGAFLTHCGWNSVLESLSNGVPLLGFPQMAEQGFNLKLIVDEWKVALRLLPHNSSTVFQESTRKVERVAVQSAITVMMRGDKGMQARANAREWKKRAEMAVQHGSSKDNLQKLVHDLKTGLLKRRNNDHLQDSQTLVSPEL